MRDGARPSCPVPYELVAPAKPVGLSLIVRGARTRSTGHSGRLCGRYQEAITLLERLQSPDMRLMHGLSLEKIDRALTYCRDVAGAFSWSD